MVQVGILEQSVYIANTFSSILFGLELYLGFSSIHLLLINHTRRTRRQKIFHICFVIAILLTQALVLASYTAVGYYIWLKHRDFPGGPMAYFTGSATTWYNFTGICAVELTNLLGNSLLVGLILPGSRQKLIGLDIPVLHHLGQQYPYYYSSRSYVPGCNWLVHPSSQSNLMATVNLVASAGGSSYSYRSNNLNVLWIIITTIPNVLLTALISFRILSARRELVKLDLNVAPPKAYMGVVAILAEASLPFPVLGIIGAVVVAKGAEVYTIFMVLWGFYAGIAPLLIIYRVAKGTAWSNQNNIAYSDVRLEVPRITEAAVTDSVIRGTESSLPAATPV
uniref:Uncharacterized protein n=1 Tax=Moniliophthora roreri TaxID=221103 RepID=A0A0W0FDR2_MONRR